MGFKHLVESNVKKAFNMVKDLAIDVTLANKRVSHFDFDSGAPVLVASAPVYIKGILITERQRKDNPAPGAPTTGSNSMQMLFKAADMPDPSMYDTITTRDGRSWKIVEPYSNDGFVATVTIAKGLGHG